jgi:hypothetical protein
MIKFAATVQDHALFVTSVVEYDEAVLEATKLLLEADELELATQVIDMGIIDEDLCNTWVFNIFDWTESAYVTMPEGHITLKRIKYWRENGKLPPLSDPDLEDYLEYNPDVISV